MRYNKINVDDCKVFYREAGARAFQRDLPTAEVHFVNSGHFALETHHTVIANYINAFLHRNNIR